MPRLDGIDISHYQWDQGPVQLTVVRGIPTTYFATKATQSTSYVDPTYKKAHDEAEIAAFRHKLAYHWIASTKDPVAQAEHYLNTVGSFGLWGAMLDAEEKGITEAGCLAWCETVEDHLLRPTSIYSGLYVAGGTIWKSDALRMSKFGPRPMHLAAYVSETRLMQIMASTGSLGFPFHAWQFSSSGPVEGITGRCDMNRIDYPAMFDSVCGIVGSSIPLPPEENPMWGQFVRDDREPGWQAWFEGIDWNAKFWCDTVNNLGYDWNAINVPLVAKPLAALENAQKKQSRPTPFPSSASNGGTMSFDFTGHGEGTAQ